MATKDATPKKPGLTEVGKVVEEARSLASPSSDEIRLPRANPGDIMNDLIDQAAQDISSINLSAARKMAKAREAEADIDQVKKENELKDLKAGKPTTVAPLVSSLPIMGGGGIGASQATLAAAILDRLPEDQRADFIEKNKDLLFAGTPQFGMFDKLKRETGGGNGGDDITKLAAVMQAMGAEQRDSLTYMLQLQKVLSPPQPSPQTSSAADTMQLVQLMMGGFQSSIKEIAMAFSTGMSGAQEQIKSMQSSTQQAMLDQQKELMAAQRALDEERQRANQERLEQQIAALRTQAAVPAGVLQPKDIPDILNQYAAIVAQVGGRVSTESIEELRARREFDLQDKRLELEEKKVNAELALKERQADAVSSKFNALTSIFTVGQRGLELSRAMKNGGSDAAQRISSRV